MQARLYRFLSIIFVLAGLLVFMILYVQNMEGRLMDALREPMTVLMLFFPFAPAIVLSFLAKSSENKYLSQKNAKKK